MTTVQPCSAKRRANWWRFATRRQSQQLLRRLVRVGIATTWATPRAAALDQQALAGDAVQSRPPDLVHAVAGRLGDQGWGSVVAVTFIPRHPAAARPRR